MFLILFGILGKISGVFLAIPKPVLGGVTTFLFATVMTSGVRVLSYLTWKRRERFILATALAFGVGDLLVPSWYSYLFEGVHNVNSGLQGLFSSITIVLQTPCALLLFLVIPLRADLPSLVLAAGIVAVLLNLILPDYEYEYEEPILDLEGHSTSPVHHDHDPEIESQASKGKH